MGARNQAGHRRPLHRRPGPPCPLACEARGGSGRGLRPQPHRSYPRDFIPVLGYLDEVIVLPVALFLVIKTIPAPLTAEFRAEAQRRAECPRSRAGALLIVAIWIATLALTLWAFWPEPVP
jgi:hypothetical protein